MEHGGTFGALRIPNFRMLLLGTTLSNAAQWIQQVTLSWLVFDITHSGTMLGTFNVIRSIPALGLVPVAGLAIDRTDRRRLMLSVAGWLFFISLALGLVLVFGARELSFLFVFAFLAGIAQAFDQPLRQVVVFQLVPLPLAPNGVALIQTGWSLMRSIGPAVGGFLILWLGPGGNFLIQAVAYILIIFTVLRLTFPPRLQPEQTASPLQNIREGFRYVVRERTTRTFMMLGWVLPLFIVPVYTALPPIYAADVFQGGPGVLGFLLASTGVGGIVGGFVVASLGRLERRGLLQLSCLFLLSLSFVGFALSRELWLALVLLAVSGFFEMVYLITNQTLLQLSIPDGLRGRVTSVMNLNMALFPIGNFIAGAGSDLLGGPRPITLVLAALIAAVAVGAFIFAPTVRNYRLSQGLSRAMPVAPPK